MSHTNQPASGADTTPYNDAHLSCGHCNCSLKPTYQQAFDLVEQQPINCPQCRSDLLLAEADRQVLSKKLQSATRMGKLALLILGPYFLFGLIAGIYFMFFAKAPFPGFSGALVVGGVVLGFIIKSLGTDNTECDFVLFKHGEVPAATTQAA